MELLITVAPLEPEMILDFMLFTKSIEKGEGKADVKHNKDLDSIQSKPGEIERFKFRRAGLLDKRHTKKILSQKI